MVDYLVSFIQCICLIAYAYGAWLVITHKADAGPTPRRKAGSPPSRSHASARPAWHRHIAYDW